MHVVKGIEVNEFLDSSRRVYLCGNLSAPDLKSHFATDGLEIGISKYKEYTVELPHYHSWNYEFNYIICGTLKVFVFSEDKEYWLHEKDLFVIAPQMGYVTKCSPDTEVLFVKYPGGNDKVLLPLTERVSRWQEKWDNTMELTER